MEMRDGGFADGRFTWHSLMGIFLKHFTIRKHNMLLLFKVDSIVTLTDSASASDAQDGLC